MGFCWVSARKNSNFSPKFRPAFFWSWPEWDHLDQHIVRGCTFQKRVIFWFLKSWPEQENNIPTFSFTAFISQNYAVFTMKIEIVVKKHQVFNRFNNVLVSRSHSQWDFWIRVRVELVKISQKSCGQQVLVWKDPLWPGLFRPILAGHDVDAKSFEPNVLG